MPDRSNTSLLVTLDLNSKPTSDLCHLGDFGCGHGGWTPVMRIDGNKVCRFSKHTKIFSLKHELLVEIKNWFMLRVRKSMNQFFYSENNLGAKTCFMRI